MWWFFGAWLMAGTCSRKVPLFLACFWLVGSMFPYSTCICLTVAVWPLILKTCVRATPYHTYLPPIPFKIAQYFFLPIYRSHCACALRDCRLIVHTITGVCWIFHSRKISKYLYCACIPTYLCTLYRESSVNASSDSAISDNTSFYKISQNSVNAKFHYHNLL